MSGQLKRAYAKFAAQRRSRRFVPAEVMIKILQSPLIGCRQSASESRRVR